MAWVIIKPDTRRNEYVLWSTSWDTPVTVADRSGLEQWLTDLPGEHRDPPVAQLDRADRYGCSEPDLYGWHITAVIVRGDTPTDWALVDREQLTTLAQMMLAGRDTTGLLRPVGTADRP